MIQPIFLVGARGSGKSTIGRMLAAALASDFVDTDSWLLEHGGESVADIVAREGWAGFRQRESQALHTVAGANRVVATGGGAVLSADNRRFMRSQGVVFWLHAPVSTLVGRLEAEPETAQRPTLTGRSITDEVEEVLLAREPLYRDAAHFILAATQTPQEIVSTIIDQLQQEPGGQFYREMSAPKRA